MMSLCTCPLIRSIGTLNCAGKKNVRFLRYAITPSLFLMTFVL